MDTIANTVTDAEAGARSPDARPETTDAPADESVLNNLLAEHKAVIQKFAVRAIGKAGHTVEVAVNGAIAVSVWESGGFDAILMDMQMPEMVGLEATRVI